MQASSHRIAADNPDPSANTTDIYASSTGTGIKPGRRLGVYPHQEAGIGPNKLTFDDAVLYEIRCDWA
jgi:hypothetical protein